MSDNKAERVKAMSTGQLVANLTILALADEAAIDYEFVRLAKAELESRDTEDEKEPTSD